MRQRVMIAIALACDPKVLIADEPTTALDVTIQAQILELVKELRRTGHGDHLDHPRSGCVAGIADRVIVMYGGQSSNMQPVRELFGNPQHPYTRALLQTIPATINGMSAGAWSAFRPAADLRRAASACPFARAAESLIENAVEEPALVDVREASTRRCWDLETEEAR